MATASAYDFADCDNNREDCFVTMRMNIVFVSMIMKSLPGKEK